MKEESHNPWIDPELEARIVALVLGEASDCERDELDRLIEERPELAAFKKQIQSVHGLLRDVATGELVVEDDDWKLSAERRSAVLAVIRGEVEEQSARQVVTNSAKERKTVTGNFFWNFSKIAAVLCVVAITGSLAVLELFNSASLEQPALVRQLASSEEDTPDSKDASEHLYGENSGLGGKPTSMDDALFIAADENSFGTAAPAAVAEFDYEKSSKSALSAIRGSLGHYDAAASTARVNGPGHPSQQTAGSSDLVAAGLEPSYAAPSTGVVDRRGLSVDSWHGEVAGKVTKGFALPAVERYREARSKESVTWPSDDGITLPKSRTPDRDGLYSRQRSEAVTGPDVGQPRGESMAEPAKQHNRWDYTQNSNEDFRRRGGESATSPRLRLKTEVTNQPAATTRGDVTHGIEKRVKDSLGQLHVLSELHGNTNVAGNFLLDNYDTTVDEQEEGPQPELKNERDELLWQRGRPAIAGGSHWHEYVPPMLEDNSGSMKKAPAKKSTASSGLNEKTAEDEAFSTFSLHVSDVSFKLARAALAHGEWPEAAKVRIEEFVNAFDYGDPMPGQSEKVACCLEQSIHPFLQQRNLLRISMRTAAAGRSSKIPLRLTFLLDNSGSMERIDRQQTVRRAFALLAQQLKPIDQVTLISFARGPRLLADKVSGSQSHQLVQLIDNLPSEGGTNIEAALQLGFEKAQEQQVDNAQNRIILLTDGAVNLGDANPESLSRMVTTMRNAGIAFDAAGISAEGLNDEVLEALTRQGDGRYYLLDSPAAADDGFARQIAGALRPSAKNVKVQIEFNPKRVGRYKLLGFEKHRLNQEDFRNDKVDAAEMAAAEAGVAVYQFEAKPDGAGDVGSLAVRFRDLSTGQMIENRWPIPYQADAPRLDQAAPSLRIATSAALLAARLRGEPLGESVDLKTLSNLIAGLPDRDRNADRVQQLQLMIQQARQVSGN